MKLRTLEISKTKKYAGRNEVDYINELLSENAIFVTSDAEFVTRVIKQNIKHAGIVHIPEEIDREEKMLFAWAAAGYIRGLADNSSLSLHNIIIEYAHDGVHIIEKGTDKLVMSFDWLEQEAHHMLFNSQRGG